MTLSQLESIKEHCIETGTDCRHFIGISDLGEMTKLEMVMKLMTVTSTDTLL